MVTACQTPTAFVPVAQKLQAQHAAPQWQELTTLSPSQAQALKSALIQRSALGSQTLGRDLLERLMPKMTQRYQYLLHPRTLKSDALPKGAEPLTLQSHDGLPLKGFWLNAQTPASSVVVVVHGYQLNKYMAYKKYGFLNRDHHLLFVDLRAHNQQGGESTLGIKESKDLLATLQWVTQHKQVKSLGLLGESMGGAIAIVAGAQWVQSPQQKVLPLKAVWSDGAYADLDHAIAERVHRKLAEDLNMSPDFFNRWLAGLVSDVYRAWLAQDTQVANAEKAAAPREFLPRLAPYIAYGQVHSTEDEQTAYENALILEKLARPLGRSLLFWPTTGKHVESYKHPQYAPRALDFFGKSLGS